MLNSSLARRGMVTSPHHLASRSGLAILREGAADPRSDGGVAAF